MTHVIKPFNLLVIALVGWLNRHQQGAIVVLAAERSFRSLCSVGVADLRRHYGGATVGGLVLF